MFTGDLERKTYADVEAFLAEKPPENLRLEYKREVTDRIARTIAAMANSEGGLIIIGIEEEGKTGKPKLPPAGIDLGKDPITSVRSMAHDDIHEPITDLDIGTYSFPSDSERGVLVVRVHQSERVPHAVGAKHTFLHRVGAQAMKEGDDLDAPINVEQMLWLAERRSRNQQMIGEAMARCKSRLLREPMPANSCRFNLIAYPAVAHADTLTVKDLRDLVSLRNYHGTQFPFPPLRAVSSGLVSTPESWRYSSYYFDITGLTACTGTWMIEGDSEGPRRIYGVWWYGQALQLLEWVGLASKKLGWGGAIRVQARLQGVLGTQIVLNHQHVLAKHAGSDPSLDNEVLAEASAPVDELASDPGPCVAQLSCGLASAFGQELSHTDMLSLLRFTVQGP